MQLKRYALEHNTEKIDWNNIRQLKWSISYNHNLDIYSTTNIREIGVIYFTNQELVEQAIKEIGEDNIKKLFEEEE